MFSSHSLKFANSVRLPLDKSRKPKSIRAFQGLAGSPLALVAPPHVETEPELFLRLDKEAKAHKKHQKQIAKLQRKFDKKAGASKSDHTLRIPKSPDREDPIAFDVWYDEFGQKHGQIDLDCSFQEYAFDPHLRGGTGPDGVKSFVREGASRSESAHILDTFGVDVDAPKNERIGIRTGLLPGERERKPRRATAESWWISDPELLKDFLKDKFDDDGQTEAEKCAYVLHFYYLQSRSDAEIADDFTELDLDVPAFFQTAKDCKSYRQYVVRQGAKMFRSLYKRPGFGGRVVRRGKMRGMRCQDPTCTQCSKNEVDIDYRF
jgi:hypothetical protein